ncbi:MAG TPA: methyltransferase domain-containing protein [Ktedonobacterales bacterium]|nr:methyltransferase domain-containing protein [Ktedonobacterales bacterium]
MGADTWSNGAKYEAYVGRWSRLVAREFVPWLAVPSAKRWLDVGCGSGALTQTILAGAEPDAVTGVDRSEGFLSHARATITDPRAHFLVGDAQALPVESGRYDAIVSGLVLNFVPDSERAVAEMARAATPGGTVAVYVWDYAGEMQFMRAFWDAAAEVDPGARELDEGSRFPICHPDALERLFSAANLCDVTTRAIDIDTTFRDFDDYWTPFLGGQGAAPSYLETLDEERRTAIRERLRAAAPTAPDGSISLTARVWATRASR